MHTPATRQARVAGNGDGAPRADAHAVLLAPQSACKLLNLSGRAHVHRGAEEELRGP